MSGTSIQSFLKRAVFRRSLLGLALFAMVAVAVTFFLARYRMAQDLEDMAQASVKAFRGQILEGDIRTVEAELHDMLQLRRSEDVAVLDKSRLRIYNSQQVASSKIELCQNAGLTCFDGYFGNARVLMPIYFDQDGKNLFGYLYLSKRVAFDWSYLFIVFALLCIGYVGLVLGLLNVLQFGIAQLSREIETWSARLKQNPKDSAPLSEAPFEELSTLKEAIEGLNCKIEKYENTASHKAKLLLLRGIAHDILSPVAQLQMNIATLVKSDHKRDGELMVDIQESLKKVSDIASQVKALKHANEPVNSSNLVISARQEIDSLRKTGEVLSKGLQIQFTSGDLEQVETTLSQTEVARILNNLVQNAAHASAPGSAIEVEVQSHEKVVSLVVKDSGCGLPAHLTDRVFEPDFTLKPGTGTGLGLAIVKYICEQRDGTVNFQSTPGRGTEVTIQVPRILEGNCAAIPKDLLESELFGHVNPSSVSLE